MQRREILKLSAAVPAVLPGVAEAQQGDKSPVVPPVKAIKSSWTPRALDAHQNDTVVVLSDLILPATDTPGAKAANVNRYIDLLLADGPEQERLRFLSGLGWLDSYSSEKYGKTFVRCSPAEQVNILETLDTTEDADLAPGNQFFRMAKSLISRMYYGTEIGFKELNKGGRVPASVGCKHPEHA
jgi:hypothetical protein